MKKVKKAAVTLAVLTTTLAGPVSLLSSQVLADNVQDTTELVADADSTTITLDTDSGSVTVVGSTTADLNQSNTLNVNFSVPEGQSDFFPDTNTRVVLTITNGTFTDTTGSGTLRDTVYGEVVSGDPADFSLSYTPTSADNPVIISVEFSTASQNVSQQNQSGEISIPVVDQALIDAKQTANGTINNLPNLSQADKDKYNQQVADAPDQAGIDNAVKEAQSANLDAGQAAANDIIENLPYLSSGEKQIYQNDVGDASDQAGIDSAVKEAEDQNLKNQKAAAIKVIDALPNLGGGEKQTFEGDINEATSPDEVTDYLNKANAADAAALEGARSAAEAAINGLTNLDDSGRAPFLSQLNDAGTIAEVQKAQSDAEAANALAQEKKDAKDTISNLTDLTPEQTADFNNDIDKATNDNDIQNIINEATDQNAANQTANALVAARADAVDKINALPNLDQATKDGYVNEVGNELTLPGVAAVLNDAQTANDEVLQDRKTAVIREIGRLPNLQEDDKNGFIERVTDAPDIASVNDILKEAQNASTAAAVILGDVNGDGVVDQKDVDALNEYLLFGDMPDGVDPDKFNEAADLNSDGTINQEDATILQEMVNPTSSDGSGEK